MPKKIAILQSNYIPWKGYFDIINRVDEFILYDTVQYTKNDWRNRNLIKTQNGLKWLTVPVIIQNSSQRICETKTVNNLWRVKHWKSLNQYYGKARYFSVYRDVFHEAYCNHSENLLSAINYTFINTINYLLGIDTKISFAAEYQCDGERCERLISLCHKAGASTYLSGPSAKGYLDESLFKAEKIHVEWMDYSGYPEYEQFYPPFAHGVTILDLIFHQGPKAIEYLQNSPRVVDHNATS